MIEPNPSSTIFERLCKTRDDKAKVLSEMVAHFRETSQPMELFEALKMQIRGRLNLPLTTSEHDQSRPEEIEHQLEMGLLDACREVSDMLFAEGKVAEGWMYLRPTGDKEMGRKRIAEIAITEENLDAMVQVLVNEGLDVGRGFAAVVKFQGTCNSITLYEQAIASQGKRNQQAAASVLLNHLYDELVDLVRADITRRSRSNADARATEHETLLQMITACPSLFDQDHYHLDTTHLASTIRIASILDDPQEQQRAFELCQYGRRLAATYQYPGDEPFVDFYPAYSAYYSVLLGNNREAGLKLFERKARTLDTKKHGTAGIETYIDLLDRCGQSATAIQVAVDLVPSDVPSQRLIPRLLELRNHIDSAEQRERATETILDYCRTHNDVLGYTAAMLSLPN
ncbi:hypothetical protein Q31b_09470 [Novipirellula aureliae]|uniref:Uncharacterized protein n=1 Tax=Novipirellula aureliae TaxID=2527966 RepID=A0A5C6EDI2_9BACT|nr:hypothetical protein [Novipirellula aureliae]TWU45771.1 hypothetical protein Q31b_09470 [Novipirellula aureliae]